MFLPFNFAICFLSSTRCLAGIDCLVSVLFSQSILHLSFDFHIAFFLLSCWASSASLWDWCTRGRDNGDGDFTTSAILKPVSAVIPPVWVVSRGPRPRHRYSGMYRFRTPGGCSDDRHEAVPRRMSHCTEPRHPARAGRRCDQLCFPQPGCRDSSCLR